MLKTVSTANGLVSPTFSGNITLSDGNLVQGTAGKGVNFTANTPAAGMTSQLLNAYEQGTWTPTDVSGAGLTFASSSGRYTKVGNVVTLFFKVKYPVTANGSAAKIGGLPFTAIAGVGALDVSGSVFTFFADATSHCGYVGVSSTQIDSIQTLSSPSTSVTNASLSNQNLYFSGTYISA